jgi:Cu2+-exporting ATPase
LGFVALGSSLSSSILAAPILNYYSVGVMVWGGTFIWKRMFIKLKEEKKATSETVLVSLSIMCLASGQVLASSIALIFASVADRLQLQTEDNTRKKLLHLFDQQLSSVWVVKNGVECQVPIDQLHAKDIIAIHTGEMIPVDAVIIEGFISVDQHVLTGESQPVEKGIGDSIYASTLVVTGKAYASVEKMGKDTVISQIAEILDNTLHYTQQNVQARSAQFTDGQATPVLTSTAALLLLSNFYMATSFIVSWSPGRVKILSSIAMLNHLRLASEDGILIKDGRALEQFHHVDVVVFDKTGTLTNEQPEVGEIFLCNGFTEKEVLTYTAAAEVNLTHPIARAIIQKAKEKNLALPEKEEISEYQLGYGIRVGINGKIIRVGSKRFIEQESIRIPNEIQQAYEKSHQLGNSVVFATLGDELMGAIELCTTVRTEAAAIIRFLRKNGVSKIAIVSGDHEEPTRNLAKKLGADDYVAEALPQDKINYIKKLQEDSKIVCFVGDGVNDSLALKQAQVGISMSGASSIATETAQIVFMKSDLSGMPHLSNLSKSLNENISRNIVIASWTPGIVGTGAALLFNASALPIIMFSITCLGIGLGNVALPLLTYRSENKHEAPLE